VPQNKDATVKATEPAIGDPPFAHREAATVHAAAPQQYTLQFLMFFIKKRTDPNDQPPQGQ